MSFFFFQKIVISTAPIQLDHNRWFHHRGTSTRGVSFENKVLRRSLIDKEPSWDATTHGRNFVRRPRTYVYCSWFRHEVSIPISLRRVYDVSELTLCLSYELYETHRHRKWAPRVSPHVVAVDKERQEAEEKKKLFRNGGTSHGCSISPTLIRGSWSREILKRFRLRYAVMGRAQNNGFAGSNGMLLCGR